MVEPGWLLSPPGRPFLASILHKNQRRVFGLLERPALPPALSVPTATYKLFVSGRSGVGKTALVAALLGSPAPTSHRETLGIEVSTLFWPAVPLGSERPVLFQLRFWDCGESALRKFEHLLPACREEADAVLLLFSFTDRASFEELPARLARVLQPSEDTLRVVVGTRYRGSPAAPTPLKRSASNPLHRPSLLSHKTPNPERSKSSVSRSTLNPHRPHPQHLSTPKSTSPSSTPNPQHPRAAEIPSPPSLSNPSTPNAQHPSTPVSPSP